MTAASPLAMAPRGAGHARQLLLAAIGVLILSAAWLGAFERALPGPFSAHMTMHMAVVAVASPLIAFGVAGTAADPARRLPRLCAVVPASLAELILVWAWHTPALHQAARHSSLAFALEQGSFLLSGLWLWTSAVGGDRRERAGAGIVGLLLTCMHMTLLGALLALPPRALYDHGHADGAQGAHDAHSRHAGNAERRAHAGQGARAGQGVQAEHGASAGNGALAEHGVLAGHAQPELGAVAEHGAPAGRALSALADQHLGGAIMIVLGGASYLLGGLWLAYGLLRERRITPAATGRPPRQPPPTAMAASIEPAERLP